MAATPPVAARAGRSLRNGVRYATSFARVAPHFVIIGAQRAGTTSLYDYVAQHPQVRRALGKGANFFDASRPPTFAWYRAHFPLVPLWGSARWVTGEASPEYLPHPHAPRRLAEALPDCRLIAVLRDPVDRAASHHAHEVAKGREPLNFADAVDAEPERIAGEFERALADPAYDSFALRHQAYLHRGRYAEQLERWLAVFPAEQLLVLRSEDLFADPGGETSRVARFLGLPLAPLRDPAPRNARSYEAAEAELRSALRVSFRHENDRLERLVGLTWPM